MSLYTTGYEGKTPDELVATLRQAGVTRVVDVRQLPLSRKPGFSKSAMATFLTSHGIEYIGFTKLGTPPTIRDRYKKNGDFARLRQDYLAYIGTQGPAVEELRELAAHGGSCLLCFERDPAQCHRSILAEVLVKRAGPALQVQHLGVEGKGAPEGDLFGPEGGAPPGT